MSNRRSTKRRKEDVALTDDTVREQRDSGFVSKLRRRAQKREAEFQEAHPSPDMQVTMAFASRNGATYAEVDTEETKKKSALRRITSQWWDRLLGAASDRSFAAQAEQYASHQTKRDYIFNTVGHTIWGFVFPLLTIVVTQLTDIEKAGMFSFAFVVGTLMMIAAQYGVRTYQVSDLEEEHSFSDYQINRITTVLLAVAVGYLFIRLRGYEGPMVQILAGVMGYRLLDALADCYEGRLQQMDKMYLAGISQMLRAIAGLVVFTVVLLVGKSVGAASVGMAIAAGATFLLITFPLAMLETPKSRQMSFQSIGSLFKQCFPIFVALFLYAVVDNTPKFVMEATLPYGNQLYFNAMYFPAQAILLVVGLIYKPQLVRMAASWADPGRRKKFDIFIVVMLLGVVLITVIMVLFMKYAGVMILGLLYGVDFEKYRMLCYMMIVAGGMTGAIDFLYQVITIMRRQELVTRTYLIAFLVGVVSSILLIHFGKLEGAVTSYVLVMTVLVISLLWVYVSQRVTIAKHPERDMALLLPAAGETSGVNAALSGYGPQVVAAAQAQAGGGAPEATCMPNQDAAISANSRVAQVGGGAVHAGGSVRGGSQETRRGAHSTSDARLRASRELADSEKPATRRLGHHADVDEDRKRANAAAAARSAIIAEEISALDKILPAVDGDAGDSMTNVPNSPDTANAGDTGQNGEPSGTTVDAGKSQHGNPADGGFDGR